jgi:hypothetical protein
MTTFINLLITVVFAFFIGLFVLLMTGGLGLAVVLMSGMAMQMGFANARRVRRERDGKAK